MKIKFLGFVIAFSLCLFVGSANADCDTMPCVARCRMNTQCLYGCQEEFNRCREARNSDGDSSYSPPAPSYSPPAPSNSTQRQKRTSVSDRNSKCTDMNQYVRGRVETHTGQGHFCDPEYNGYIKNHSNETIEWGLRKLST